MSTAFIFKLFVIIILTTTAALFYYFRKKIQKRVDNIISKSVIHQLSLLAIAAGLTLGLLLLAIWLVHGMDGLELYMSDRIFSFINPGSSFAKSLNTLDRIWAIIFGIFGMIFLGGMLVAVFSNILERRVEKVKNGQAYYRFSGHIVIIGYDKIAAGLVKQLSKKHPGCDIVIQTIQEVPKVYHELFSRISDAMEKKITIMSGSRNSIEDVEKLQVEKCREIFLLGENKEYDHDSLNIECLKKIGYILKDKNATHAKRCNVFFEYQSTFAIFQQQDLPDIKPWIDFVPFNFHEIWAKKIFVDGKYISPENIEEVN